MDHGRADYAGEEFKANPPPTRPEKLTEPEPLPDLTEEELEKKVAIRPISGRRAENILDFYKELAPREKESVRRGLAELLNEQTRRLSDVREGSIAKVRRSSSIYELKLSGVTLPIRIYFGLDPELGPMLISAHHKKSDLEQVKRIDSAEEAWKKYTNG